jgi:hypothetical protein
MFKSQSPCNLGVWDVIRKTSFQKWFLSLPKNLSWEVLLSILTKSLNFEFISSFNFCGYIIWFIDWNDRGWNKFKPMKNLTTFRSSNANIPNTFHTTSRNVKNLSFIPLSSTNFVNFPQVLSPVPFQASLIIIHLTFLKFAQAGETASDLFGYFHVFYFS